MPRTLTVDLPGVPRIRALCSDSLGLIKVIETGADLGAPKVVARWGDPDPQQGVLCMSQSYDASPSLAVARKSSTVDVIDPVSGLLESRLVVPKSSTDGASNGEALDVVCGVHLFSEKSPWGKAVLTCTELRDAVLQGLPELDEEQHPKSEKILSRWSVSQTGSVSCMAVDTTEQYAAFGGKGVDVSVWDIKKGSRIWSAKAPHRDNLGLISPAWVTAVAFLTEDHRKVVVGTGHHQVRLYEISSQRRPVLAFDYGEAPIRSITRDPDGFSVYVGTGAGDLACFDMRTGKLVGGFKGKCAGSIRSVVRHPFLPLIASCGLDRYLRIHSTKTRQLLGSLFLKQQLVSVLFDVRDVRSTTAVTTSEDAVSVQSVASESNTLNVNGEKAPTRSRLKGQAEEDGEILSLNGKKIVKRIKSKTQARRAEEELGSRKLTKSKSKWRAEQAPSDNRGEDLGEPPFTHEEKEKKRKKKKKSDRQAGEVPTMKGEELQEETQLSNGELRGEDMGEPPFTHGLKEKNRKKKKSDRQAGEVPTMKGEGLQDETQLSNGENVKKTKTSKRKALEASVVHGEGVTEEGPTTSGEKTLQKSKRSQAEDVDHMHDSERISRVESLLKVGKSRKKVRQQGRSLNQEG